LVCAWQGKTGFHKCIVASLAIRGEVTEAPAASRSVFCGVLDHKLNIGGLPGNKRLVAAKDFVVCLRRQVSEVQSGNDCAVRERELAFAVSIDGHIIPQNGSQTIEVAFFVRNGNQPPVAVSRRNRSNECWGGRLLGTSKRGGRGDKNKSHGGNGD